MKIVVSDDLPVSAVDLLRAVDGWTVDARAGRPRAELLHDVADADALLVRSATKVDRALLEAAPKLRVVARAGTGVDNVDLDVASARGVMVTNAPGANSVSVAEHAFALLLSLARRIPAADAAMKQRKWEKKKLTGAELRDKTLGVVGLGRIGQEVAHRARVFGMKIIAHDPFLPTHVAADMGVELLDLDTLCERADMITLHLPVTPQTRGLFNAERLARCRPHALIVNTARGELIDVDALKAALDAGTIGGAGLDVFEQEPPTDWSIAEHPKVVATPHIAGSTSEAQELVGIDVAIGVREFLLHGVVRNAVNFPSVPAEEFSRLQPFMTLSERLGQLAGQLTDGPIHTVGVRYYGALANGPSELTTGSVLVGLFRRVLSSGVTLINARALASDRGLEVTETRSSRPRTFANLISVKAHTPTGEHWVEGTVFGTDSPRVTSVDGVSVEAALEGTLLIIRNDDQPGVIGEVGTRLGRHGVNIGTFALGRSATGAVGVVSVDEGEGAAITDVVLDDIRKAPHVRSVTVARIL
jgi:D-3-phosphoglycerate dehydrogenase